MFLCDRQRAIESMEQKVRVKGYEGTYFVTGGMVTTYYRELHLCTQIGACANFTAQMLLRELVEGYEITGQ
jgi:hypothetical protein